MVKKRRSWAAPLNNRMNIEYNMLSNGRWWVLLMVYKVLIPYGDCALRSRRGNMGNMRWISICVDRLAVLAKCVKTGLFSGHTGDKYPKILLVWARWRILRSNRPTQGGGAFSSNCLSMILLNVLADVCPGYCFFFSFCTWLTGQRCYKAWQQSLADMKEDLPFSSTG